MLEAVTIIWKVHSPWSDSSYIMSPSFPVSPIPLTFLSAPGLSWIFFATPLTVSEILPLPYILLGLGILLRCLGFLQSSSTRGAAEPQRREESGWLVQVEVSVLWVSDCKSEDPSSSPSSTTSSQRTFTEILNLLCLGLFIWRKMNNHVGVIYHYTN